MRSEEEADVADDEEDQGGSVDVQDGVARATVQWDSNPQFAKLSTAVK